MNNSNKIPTDVSGKWVNIDDVNKIVNSIIEECISIVYRETNNDEENYIRYKIKEDMKKHFNVS